MSVRRGSVIGTWAALVLAASSVLAQTAPPTETPAPPRGDSPARPSQPGSPPAEAAQPSDASRQRPGETTVDAPARSREQATPRLEDVLRTVPGVTPR